MASYYNDDKDVSAAEESVRSWASPALGDRLVVLLVSDLYDRKKADWPALEKLLLALTAGAAPALTPSAALAGLRRLYDGLEDAACDLPVAPERLGELAGALVAAGRITLNDVCAAIVEAAPEGDPPGALRSAGLAMPAFRAVLTAVGDASGYTAAEAVRAAAAEEGGDEDAAAVSAAAAAAAESAAAAAQCDAFRAAAAKGLTLRSLLSDADAAAAGSETEIALAAGLGALFPYAPLEAKLREALGGDAAASSEAAAAAEAPLLAWLTAESGLRVGDDPQLAAAVTQAVLRRAAPAEAGGPPATLSPSAAVAGLTKLLRAAVGGKAACRLAAVYSVQALCEQAGQPAGLALGALQALQAARVVDTDDLTRWTDDTLGEKKGKIPMLKQVSKWITEERDAAESSDDE
jgi:hypothetical protein